MQYFISWYIFGSLRLRMGSKSIPMKPSFTTQPVLPGDAMIHGNIPEMKKHNREHKPVAIRFIAGGLTICDFGIIHIV